MKKIKSKLKPIIGKGMKRNSEKVIIKYNFGVSEKKIFSFAFESVSPFSNNWF
jgi:hypothetical protein